MHRTSDRTDPDGPRRPHSPAQGRGLGHGARRCYRR